MGNATNLIILCSKDDKGVEWVNKYPHDGIFALVSIHDPSLNPRGDPYKWYGGSKSFWTECLVGAVNWLDIASLVVWLKAIEWDDPDRVQFLYCNDSTNGLYKLITI